MKTFKRLLRSIIVNILGTLFFLGVIVGVPALFYLLYFHQDKIEYVEVLIQEPEANIHELLNTEPPKYGLDPLLAKAVGIQESTKKIRMDSVRYEESQRGIATKVVKESGLRVTEDNIRALASSHCSMQVMGYNAYSFGKTWADLYNPKICVEIALQILSDCISRESGKTNTERIYGGLRCYNAGPSYASRGAGESYAEEVMWKYLGLLIEERGLSIKRKGDK